MSKNLREMRVKKGLSQSKLSELTGIIQAKLSRWELEKEPIPKSAMKEILAVLDKVDGKQLEIIGKKRINKSSNAPIKLKSKKFSKTPKNKEYLDSLQVLEKHFKDKNYKAKGMSFFAGCGGLCYGAKAAGIDIVGTNELIEEYKEVYALNFPDCNFLPNDVRDVKKKDIDTILDTHGEIDVVIGGPPCQGFSLAGKRDVNDDRNTLFEDYLKLSKHINPKVVVIENVKLLTSMKDPNGRFVKDRVLETFEEIGYRSKFFIVNAKNFGVPQHRERVIFIGVRKDINLEPSIPSPLFMDHSNDLFDTKPEPYCIGDAISDLSYLESGEKDKVDEHHWAVNHPAHVIKWLKDVPQGKSAHENEDPDLRPPSGYNTTYKRQVWEEPGSTVATTFGMISGCRNVHPFATRSMTIREALRIQSFPDSFHLTGKAGTMRTVIGNAVPPMLSYHLMNHVLNNYIL